MKVLITILIGLLVMGCGALSPEQKRKALRDSVVGEYGIKYEDGDTYKLVLLENGIAEDYYNGKKQTYKKMGKWKIAVRKRPEMYIHPTTGELVGSGGMPWVFIGVADGEIHYVYDSGDTKVFRINKDRSITWVLNILVDGTGGNAFMIDPATGLPLERQFTYKKIK